VGDNTNRFDGLAADYDRFRPVYPLALFRRIVARAPAAPGLAADVAAGTGISAAVLLEALPADWRVIAVEPGADMRRVLESRFAEEPRVEVREGAAEVLGLPDASLALITVCAAFHWFEPERFFAEARRVLVKGGVLAVANNLRLSQPVTDAFDAYVFQYEPSRLTEIPDRSARQGEILQAAGWQGFARDTMRWSRPMAMADLIGDWLTRSSAKPLIEKDGRDAVTAALAEIYHRHQGDAPVTLDYETTAFTMIA
jgi:ubiquinone/menaquinone biosynthesis C-methylase UbiE